MARARGNEFETAFQKLEKIVARLEGEELSLDESLKLFEEGISLSRFCNTKLQEVETKIETILADAKGNAVSSPFSGDPGEDEEQPDAVDDDDGDDDSGGKIPF